MALRRRQFLGGLAGLTALGSGGILATRAWSPSGAPIPPVTAEVHPMTGRIRDYTLTAAPVEVDLGGRVVRTWAYGDSVPGKALRATAGDRLRVRFTSRLPEATSVHWHGPAIRNDMDGVPGVTTAETIPGSSTDLDFVVPNAGTHWFHPHHGLQLDRGLYAPIIVDDPNDAGGHDVEWVVVLDDWIDGVGDTPEEELARLRDEGGSGDGHGMMGMGGAGSHGMMAADGGDVAYPLYLVNGRVAEDPDTLQLRPGQRMRIRCINAAADTVFDVSLGDHDLLVTHSDGYPVEPTTTREIRLGMGERYDVEVTVGDGVFPLWAVPVGKQGLARALVRSGAGTPPPLVAPAPRLGEPPLTADRLRARREVRLPQREPDRTMELLLSGGMAPYVWTINDAVYPEGEPLVAREGELVRLQVRNMSMMSHPLHVHGHSFQLGPAGGDGPRKDTVLVPPMAAFSVDLLADNPGRWMVHCHNAYHAEAGMMTQLDYIQ